MNICFDVDGTITENPEFFSLLSHAVKASGGKVFVITSRTYTPETIEATRKELNELRIIYDCLYMLHNQVEADRICPFNDLDWYQRFIFQKTVYCKTNQVDIYFDDEVKVIDLFRKYLPGVQVFQVHGRSLTFRE